MTLFHFLLVALVIVIASLINTSCEFKNKLDNPAQVQQGPSTVNRNLINGSQGLSLEETNQYFREAITLAGELHQEFEIQFANQNVELPHGQRSRLLVGSREYDFATLTRAERQELKLKLNHLMALSAFILREEAKPGVYLRRQSINQLIAIQEGSSTFIRELFKFEDTFGENFEATYSARLRPRYKQNRDI